MRVVEQREQGEDAVEVVIYLIFERLAQKLCVFIGVNLGKGGNIPYGIANLYFDDVIDERGSFVGHSDVVVAESQEYLLHDKRVGIAHLVPQKIKGFGSTYASIDLYDTKHYIFLLAGLMEGGL